MKTTVIKFPSGGRVPAHSINPSAAKADITNAGYLMGDPDDDDQALYGDNELYGDADDDLYEGDVDGVALMSLLQGDSRQRRRLIPNQRLRRGIGIGGGILGAGALSALIATQVKKSKERKRNAAMLKSQSIKAEQSYNTNLMRNAGIIPPTQMFPFFQFEGAALTQYPIPPDSKFAARDISLMLDRQQQETPFPAEFGIGTFLAGTWTVTMAGVVGNRFYSPIGLRIGTNMLNASPGTSINVVGSFPLANGTTLAATFTITYRKGYDVSCLFYPWTLVSTRPYAALGVYNNANPIVFTVTGIPAASAVTGIVYGSTHPFTIALRTGLAKGLAR